MLKIGHFVSIWSLLFLLFGCQNSTNEIGVIETFHTPQYSFQSTIINSELIAEVSIESIADTQNDDRTTNYHAIIQNVYKGNLDLDQQTITINQKGDETSIYKGSPKFVIGESYIVFLTGSDIYQLTREEISTYTIADDQLIKNAQSDSALSSVALPFNQLNQSAKQIIETNEQYIDFQLLDKEAFEQLLVKSIAEME